MYGDRKMVFFFIAHFISTMVVWQHFAYTKFRVQEGAVPEGANMYWWKRVVPPLEFGAMHAILFQMALLPLTMARCTLANICTTFLAKMIPFQRMTAIHIHLGYTMVLIVVLSTILFFVFFGQLCAQQISGEEPSPEGVHTFCEKMRSEIMCTGYGILFSLLLVAITAYLRNKIHYEIFYYVHHLVFVMYALAIVHTLDDKNRGGQERSQTFKWFSASLVLYFTDRVYMYFCSGRQEVVEWAAQNNITDKFVVLRLCKPFGFTYRPGQYAFLCFPELDMTYHPFSIASSPCENTLDFHIEVKKDTSWTGRLWERAKQTPIPAGTFINVMGPYGSGQTVNVIGADYNEVLAIGSGTGVVPMMSLLKTTYSRLLEIIPKQHSKAVAERDSVTRDYAAKFWSTRSYSLLDLLLSTFARCKQHLFPHHAEDMCLPVGVPVVLVQRVQLRYRIRHLQKEGRHSVTYKVLMKKQHKHLLDELWKLVLLIIPCFELAMICLNISWSSMESPIFIKKPKAMIEVEVVTSEMATTCKVGMAVAITLFGIFFSTFRVGSVTWWIDLIDLAVSVACLCLWSDLDVFARFNEWQRWAYVALSAWRMFRVWLFVVLPGSHISREAHQQLAGQSKTVFLERFNFVFVSRDPAFVGHFWKELDQQWRKLETIWGRYTNRIASIEVYCTCTDKEKVEALQRKVKGTALGQAGALKLGRPDISMITQGHLLRRLLKDKLCGEGKPSFSSTLFAFCGGTGLGNVFQSSVIHTNALAKMVQDQSIHMIEFEQENYGQESQPKHHTPTRREDLLPSPPESSNTEKPKEQGWKDSIPPGTFANAIPPEANGQQMPEAVLVMPVSSWQPQAMMMPPQMMPPQMMPPQMMPLQAMQYPTHLRTW